MSKALEGRVFLLLQGPQSHFFRILAKKIVALGGRAIKLNFCGGDVFLWGRGEEGVLSFNYHGRPSHFPAYVGALYQNYAVTDLVLYGDWRPMHQDAILIGKDQGLKIWVYEEGYLRQGFVTLEENGVNGRTSLPHTSEEILSLAKTLPPFTRAKQFTDNIVDKVRFAIFHHTGNVLLFVAFPFYRTHRFTNILVELTGILPRYLKRHQRRKRSAKILSKFLLNKNPYYFYPLQLNTDSQIQLYSPYIRQEEAITTVIASFAKFAPPTSRLLIKNHPLDNGLIPYRDFIESMAQALGVKNRVTFVEDGNVNALIQSSKGVVLVNSTVGMSSLLLNKPVYCLGFAIYAIKGLAEGVVDSSLDLFWTEGKSPEPHLLNAFCQVLRAKALAQGNFYQQEAASLVADESLDRFIKAKARARGPHTFGNVKIVSAKVNSEADNLAQDTSAKSEVKT